MSKACYDCPFNRDDCFRPHCIPAEGTQKTLYTVNRKVPGPLIEVCESDTIVVDVRKKMLAESTTIHWHGFNQKGTPYMDGVPFVTQCPILPGQSFNYTFQANEPGTYFWHSHIGSQRADGLFGPLVICPRSPKLRSLRDHDEHRMVIYDWNQRDADAAFIKQYHDDTGVNPTTILINGLGRFQSFSRGNITLFTPLANFTVARDQRYTFRLINAGAEDCPIEMSIDKHVMKVISLDSNDIEPVEVDVITTWSGERVDFIVEANQQPDNYWIRYRGFGLCQNLTDPRIGVFQVAILRYEGVPQVDPVGPIGYTIPAITNNMRILNPYQRGTESHPGTNINISQLKATAPNDRSLQRKADETHFIAFDFYPRDNYDFHREGLYGIQQINRTFPTRAINTFQLNNITLKMQPFPLLSQRDQIKYENLCNSDYHPENCYPGQCACTHVIPLKLNSVVELVFVDEGRFFVVNHPLHLHGHFFRVVATENLEGPVSIDRVKQLMREGRIQRQLDRAPLKDTMKAPGGGYTIVRFVADNPGYWFFHCHFEQHSNVGMALVFKVGRHRQMPQVPANFPRCNDYK